MPIPSQYLPIGNPCWTPKFYSVLLLKSLPKSHEKWPLFLGEMMLNPYESQALPRYTMMPWHVPRGLRGPHRRHCRHCSRCATRGTSDNLWQCGKCCWTMINHRTVGYMNGIWVVYDVQTQSSTCIEVEVRNGTNRAPKVRRTQPSIVRAPAGRWTGHIPILSFPPKWTDPRRKSKKPSVLWRVLRYLPWKGSFQKGQI